MRDQITALESLQHLDLELRDLQETLGKYPQEISRCKDQLEKVKESIGNAKGGLEQVIKKKEKSELQLAQNQDAIKKAEQRLFAIKTYKEYEALQKEISETKRANLELEEQILKEMEEAEKLETLVKEKELELSQKEKDYERVVTEYTPKINELTSAYEIKRSEKQQVASLLSHDILSMYERIKKRNGVALAPARDEVCTGCNMNIPPQLFNEVLTLSRMIQCPNCHRILYCEETTSEERQTA
jgi:predicted  nucleic acid-binding Zn-ribbon protein